MHAPSPDDKKIQKFFSLSYAPDRTYDDAVLLATIGKITCGNENHAKRRRRHSCRIDLGRKSLQRPDALLYKGLSARLYLYKTVTTILKPHDRIAFK